MKRTQILSSALAGAVLLLAAAYVSVASAQQKPEWFKYFDIAAAALDIAEREGLYDIDAETCAESILSGLSGITFPSSAPKDSHTIPLPIFPKTEEGIRAHEKAREEDKFVCFDQFSRIMLPDQAKFDQERLAGKFGGIGADLREQDGKVRIHAVLEGGPAFKAGLQPDDVIVKIQRNENEEEMPVGTTMEAVQKIRGEAGTIVLLTIERRDVQEKVRITRGVIKQNAVTARGVFEGVGYVRLGSFTERSSDELEEAIKSLDLAGPNPKFILDLRENPGGLLPAAQEILFYFSDAPSDTLVSLRFRGRSAERFTIGSMTGSFINPDTGETKTPGVFKNYTVAVLIDEFSVSASEVVAGTLKDWGEKYGRFTVVGRPSLGKSVGQSGFSLPHGAVLHLTAFEFLVGNEQRSIQGVGVLPDIEVEDTRRNAEGKYDFDLTATPQDAQFQKALEILLQAN